MGTNIVLNMKCFADQKDNIVGKTLTLDTASLGSHQAFPEVNNKHRAGYGPTLTPLHSYNERDVS